MILPLDFPRLSALAETAGNAIIEIYGKEDFSIQLKKDRSPVTIADKISNAILENGLTILYPDIPVIAEESEYMPYTVRREWEYFWLIDPLDGTKEFIKRNGEFTINIALIHRNTPVAGLIYWPEKKIIYFAEQGGGSYKMGADKHVTRLKARKKPDTGRLVVLGSRSHSSSELDDFISQNRQFFGRVDLITLGSSLKFCLIAEGYADFYLRTSPTMEWDTAAGHVIVAESGKQVYEYNTKTILTYNKEDLQNGWFIVK